MKKRLVVQAEEDVEAAVAALAKDEQRTLSAMGNILLKEALSARREKDMLGKVIRAQVA